MDSHSKSAVVQGSNKGVAQAASLLESPDVGLSRVGWGADEAVRPLNMAITLWLLISSALNPEGRDVTTPPL